MSSVEAPDFDQVLIDIAKEMSPDTVGVLGSALGFKSSQIENYVATNRMGANVTNAGTLKMLRDWREEQPNLDETAAMITCLQKAGLNRIARDLQKVQGTDEKHSGGIASASAVPSASPSQRTSPQGAVSADGTFDAVSDDKLNTLAKHVPHGKYSDLSQKLGIDYNQAAAILAKHGSDSAKAIRECLGIWKDKTGGSSAELKKILYSADIGGTLVQYIES